MNIFLINYQVAIWNIRTGRDETFSENKTESEASVVQGAAFVLWGEEWKHEKNNLFKGNHETCYSE